MRELLRRLFLEPQPAELAPAPAAPATRDALAAVNQGPALVTLYNPAGDAIHVGAGEVAKWLAQGFRQTRVDLRAELDALRARFKAAHLALEALIVCVEVDGELDPHEEAQLHAARVAAADLAGSMAAILSAAELAYPLAQGQAILLVDAHGEHIFVDPNQREQYRAMGWREAHG